jgi:hypothetical protein
MITGILITGMPDNFITRVSSKTTEIGEPRPVPLDFTLNSADDPDEVSSWRRDAASEDQAVQIHPTNIGVIHAMPPLENLADGRFFPLRQPESLLYQGFSAPFLPRSPPSKT